MHKVVIFYLFFSTPPPLRDSLSKIPIHRADIIATACYKFQGFKGIQRQKRRQLQRLRKAHFETVYCYSSILLIFISPTFNSLHHFLLFFISPHLIYNIKHRYTSLLTYMGNIKPPNIDIVNGVPFEFLHVHYTE